MEDVKNNIAKNLVWLRNKKKLTQNELAREINYSDKTISKWEHGDCSPPIDVLKRLADFYNVSLDFLVTDFPEESYDKNFNVKQNFANKIIITLLAMSIVWILATIMFVYSNLLSLDRPWLLFIIAIPISSIVLLVFNCIWGKRTYTFILISVLIWSTITSIYLMLSTYSFWVIYIVGVPLQISVILWSFLKPSKKK